ncbi:MAG TPA: LptF/LptG family permease [Fimbriimonas sp.]|nr:LptF/LptG family permease [Fimbriimonas sp.]
MAKIDRLILKDLMGPWLFGVGLFSALLMAATYLGTLAGYIVDGVPPNLVIQLVGLLMPAILVKTFTMSVLLAALLGFGRLSSDSEIVALRASGASVYRIVAPVAVFSVLIAAVTFLFNEQFVPAATQKSASIVDQMKSSVTIKAAFPIARTQVTNNKLVLGIVADNVNPASQSLEGVSLIAYDKDGNRKLLAFARELHYEGESKWWLEGDITLVSADFSVITHGIDKVWPDQLPTITTSFDQLKAERDDNFDSMSMAQLRDAIAYHRAQRDKTPSVLRNYEYGYWTKVAIPLAAIIFGVLGAVLGIRNHRTGTAAGFALAVAIIFGYVTLVNFMNVWAQGGAMPPWVASFSPLAIGAVASGVIMWRRNG